MNILLLFATMFTINQPAQLPKQADTLKIDTSRYAVLPYNKSRDGFLFKDAAPANLSAAEIRQIEKVISVTVREYNNLLNERKIQVEPAQLKPKTGKPVVTKSIITRPDKYYKQIIATTNANGEKEVWVNCFCTPHEKKYWRKGVVMILDGGPCFFNLKINLATNTVMDWTVNGVN